MIASLKEHDIQNRETMIALTILKGIQLCSYMGISKLVVELDCQCLVQMLQESAESKSPIGIAATSSTKSRH